jgi:hypothetical protein
MVPIVVECNGCGKKLSAPDGARGRAANCPQCGSPITILAVDNASDIRIDPLSPPDFSPASSGRSLAPIASPVERLREIASEIELLELEVSHCRMKKATFGPRRSPNFRFTAFRLALRAPRLGMTDALWCLAMLLIIPTIAVACAVVATVSWPILVGSCLAAAAVLSILLFFPSSQRLLAARASATGRIEEDNAQRQKCDDRLRRIEMQLSSLSFEKRSLETILRDASAPPPSAVGYLAVQAALSQPSHSTDFVGGLILTLGIIISVFFLFLYDTSVPTNGAFGIDRIHNIGLQQDRTLGSITGLAIAVVGAFKLILGSRK